MATTAKVGFLGPPGTHSEAVTLYWRQHCQPDIDWQLQAYATINDVIHAVATGEIERAIVPVENSIEGSVNITLDTLAHDVDIQIEQELVWHVHHALLSKERDAPIDCIYSHPQSLAQCRGYIREHYPSVNVVSVASTSKAAEIVSRSEAGAAAIATSRAALLYNLQVIASDIQDRPNNCTRFIVLKRKNTPSTDGRQKTALVLQMNGERAGQLCDVLGELASRNVSLTRIESRPARTGLGEYIFFLDIDGSASEQNVSDALKAVSCKSRWIKILGSFDVLTVSDKDNH